MSIIYERTKTKVTNEVYHDECNDTQFQFLGDGNCVHVWNDGEIWLMLESGAVNNNGWIYCKYYFEILESGKVIEFNTFLQ